MNKKRNLFSLMAGMMLFMASGTTAVCAQELNAKVIINRSQIQGTKGSIFETLEKALNAFVNDRQWTKLQYKENERINCTFSITLVKHNEAENSFTGNLTIQSTRPVYNSSYSTTVYSIKDGDFNFKYQEHDKLEFRSDQIDNNLTAMLAYYAYLIIGMDLDTMSPMGGTEILQLSEEIANNAQNLGYTGWKAFDDGKNRFAVINDYLDGALEPLRQFNYDYYRKGLDIMANNTEEGRTAITQAIALLQTAHKNKPLSSLPLVFTDFKRDEFVNIYKSKGTSQDKETVYNILFGINASQNTYWENIKK